MQRLARGDDVVDDQHPLAADQLRVRRVDDELLDAHGGDGLDIDLKHAAHIGLRTLACEEILVRAALSGHLIQQRNALGFRCDDVVILGSQLQKLGRAVHGQLHIAEHDKGADIEIIRYLAQRQVAFHSGNVDFISHNSFSFRSEDPSYYSAVFFSAVESDSFSPCGNTQNF